jgi:hypothetical protein
MTRSKDIFFDQMQGEQADAEEQFLQMEEQQALSKSLNIFEQGLTKADVPALAEAMVSHVLEAGNPLEVAENIKVMETLIDAVKGDKRFKDYALEELTKYGKSFTSARGVKLEVAEVGGRYDYTTCNDPFIIEYEKMLKERQEFLKKLPKDGIDIVTKDGEVIKIFPPAKPASTTTYKITLPK